MLAKKKAQQLAQQVVLRTRAQAQSRREEVAKEKAAAAAAAAAALLEEQTRAEEEQELARNKRQGLEAILEAGEEHRLFDTGYPGGDPLEPPAADSGGEDAENPRIARVEALEEEARLLEEAWGRRGLGMLARVGSLGVKRALSTRARMEEEAEALGVNGLEDDAAVWRENAARIMPGGWCFAGVVTDGGWSDGHYCFIRRE